MPAVLAGGMPAVMALLSAPRCAFEDAFAARVGMAVALAARPGVLCVLLLWLIGIGLAGASGPAPATPLSIILFFFFLRPCAVLS